MFFRSYVMLLCLLLPQSLQAQGDPYHTVRSFMGHLLADSQRAITSDNVVSLDISEFRLVPLEKDPAKYAIIIEADLIPRPGVEKKTFSVAIERPVEFSDATAAVLRNAAGYRNIFSSERLLPYREINLKVYMIRLDAEEQKRFADVAALLGSVVNKSMFGPITNILGLTDEKTADSQKVLAFEGRFPVHLNYWRHNNARLIGFPYLVNEAPMGLVFQSDIPRNNTSAVSAVKNVANRVSQLVNGTDVVRNADSVQGFVTFIFSKNQLDPLPKALNSDFQVVRRSLEATPMPDSVEQRIQNVKSLLDYLGDEYPIATQASARVYIDLADIYRQYRVYRATGSGNAEKKNEIVRSFGEWLSQGPSSLSQEPSDGPRVQGLYGKEGRYPIVLFPYALTDELILSAVAWQLKLHEFVAGLQPSDLPQGTTIRDFTFEAAEEDQGKTIAAN